MVFAFPKRALVIAFSVCLAGRRPRMRPEEGRRWGTPAANVRIREAAKAGCRHRSTRRSAYENASFGTGAVGLRNRGDGGIKVSGGNGSIKRALIYWAVITDGPPAAAASQHLVEAGRGNGPFVDIDGTADRRRPVAMLGGRHDDRLPRQHSALGRERQRALHRSAQAGRERQHGRTEPLGRRHNPPLFEGVSIVLIGTGTSTVAVYEDWTAQRSPGRCSSTSSPTG